MADRTCLLCQVERAWCGGFECSGAGFKKWGWRGSYKTGAQILDELLIVGAQSVKHTDRAGQKGYDAGQKVSGIKRHIAVDTQSLPHAITTADVTDRKGALLALDRCRAHLNAVQCILADGGSVGPPCADTVKELLGADVQIAKRNELHPFAVMPQRRAVERSFAWIEKCRRLWKKLRTQAQHQLAVHPSRLPSPLAQKIVNRL